jgi:predicted nuclease of predicted toxin-antitoxin system
MAEEHGHDTLHTLDLPLGNRTPDSEIVARANRDGRIVVSKDSDFVQSFLLTGQPALLLVSTGNVSNVELEGLIHRNMAAIEKAFVSARYVEVTRSTLIVHE